MLLGRIRHDAHFASSLGRWDEGENVYREIVFSREELFERVWSTPLLALAKEVGVSDVALGKTCRRYDIPLPGRGYWAQDASVRPARSALPKPRDARHDRITFTVAGSVDQLRAARTKSERAPIDVVVPHELDDPHKLVSVTRNLATSAKVGEDGRVLLDFKRALSMHVSPALVDRALRLLDALIKASESEGAKWRVDTSGSTVVEWSGEPMKIVLKEKMSKREFPPPEPEKPRRGQRYEPNWAALNWRRFEWVSTGVLTLYVDEYVEGYAQRTWNDTATAKLEEKLGDVIAGLPLIVSGIVAKREKHAAWQREWDAQQRREREAARAKETQRRLRANLVRATTSWERATRLRSFCDEVERATSTLPEPRRAAAVEWLRWARQQAERLDPLANNFEELIAMDVDLPEGFVGPRAWERVDEGWWSKSE